MFNVSGNTFPHRELLKAMGGQWNAIEKVWKLPAGIDPARLNGLGLTVVNLTGSVPTETIKSNPAYSPKIVGVTHCYGDNTDFLNYFDCKNPAIYFGFSSLDNMISYIENIPRSVKNDGIYSGRTSAWKMSTDKTQFTLTNDMREAIDIARNGWSEGVQIANDTIHYLESHNVLRRQREHSMIGGRVNVGRMLSGNPIHMIRRTKQPSKKIIQLFVASSIASSIKIKQTSIRAGCVAAICDTLEQNGYQCEIFVTDITENNDGSSLCHIVTNVKQAGEKLNINNIVFALGHPSYCRRFVFALQAIDMRFKHEWNNGFGNINYNPLDNPETNSFLINQIRHGFKGTNVIDILNAIIPDGLPVEIKG